jgi:hypothetical protein
MIGEAQLLFQEEKTAMQKLILSLLTRSSKVDTSTSSETKTQPMMRLTHAVNQKNDAEDTDTRPTYRIGKHNPSDVHRIIDLSG